MGVEQITALVMCVGAVIALGVGLVLECRPTRQIQATSAQVDSVPMMTPRERRYHEDDSWGR